MYSLPIEHDVGGLDHRVGRLDRSDETFGFDQSERFLTHMVVCVSGAATLTDCAEMRRTAL